MTLPAGTVDIKQGTWRISLYWDSKDETSNFGTYVFMFGSGGIFMAHQGATMITGTCNENSNRISFSDAIFPNSITTGWLLKNKYQFKTQG
ncbi:MAG: hypothetical protein K2X48_10235 [Chitinophagaceae bacterium]|nr:hypothetical protein [Chitinophagaceae bacterium]